MRLEFLPASPGRWDDVAAVVGSCSEGRRCWCAFWYLPNAEYRANGPAANRAVLEHLVGSGAEPGLIAYADGAPAGWVGVAPRQRYDRLNRSRNFRPLDDLPVWSVTCFIVARPFRGKGLLTALAAAAAEFAFAHGAPAIEGYPLEPGPRTGQGDLFVGTPKAFVAAGYREVARPLERRPIMRRWA